MPPVEYEDWQSPSRLSGHLLALDFFRFRQPPFQYLGDSGAEVSDSTLALMPLPGILQHRLQSKEK